MPIPMRIGDHQQLVRTKWGHSRLETIKHGIMSAWANPALAAPHRWAITQPSLILIKIVACGVSITPIENASGNKPKARSYGT